MVAVSLVIYSFTGPSKLSLTNQRYCEDILSALPMSVTRRSGGAYGLDTLVALSAPPENIHLFVPAGERFNELLLDLGAVVTYVHGGYRVRNKFLVHGSNILHAFVHSPSFYRSGEWMTINIAKRLRMPVEFHLLPG